MDNNLCRLILIALGKKNSFDRSLSENEWSSLYGDSVKQALTGVCFAGIERLPKDQRPDLRLMMGWLGQTEVIKGQNELECRRAAEVTGIFAEGGFKSVVLKGQGAALLYRSDDNPFLAPALRTSGDIDLWVDGSRREIIDFLNGKGYRISSVRLHHVCAEIFDDVEVEVHNIPSFSYNPFRNGKYKKWFGSFDWNLDPVAAANGYAYPPVRFNLVYSMLHIFTHFFDEGVGLRQLMDYYFILENASASERESAMDTLRWMGLARFAGALMYVEKTIFLVPDADLLCPPSEKHGEFLLGQIMSGGNFGKYDSRIRKAHSAGRVHRYIIRMKRLAGMVRFYPTEVLWAPIFKPVHFLWRAVNGYLENGTI